MNFYHVYYKRQVFDRDKWIDTYYTDQGILVLADNIDEAKQKIRKCLDSVETGNYRAVTNWDVTECTGLDFRHGFDNYFCVYPIK